MPPHVTPLVQATVRLYERLITTPFRPGTTNTSRRLVLAKRISHRLEQMSLAETDAYYARIAAVRDAHPAEPVSPAAVGTVVEPDASEMVEQIEWP